MSALGRARGLGAARQGVGHWWAQRVTALALVPLILWLVVGVATHTGAGHGAVVAWISEPLVAIALVLTLFATFLHAKLGLEVVIEDYVHGAIAKHVMLLAVTFLSFALGAGSIFAVLKIALRG